MYAIREQDTCHQEAGQFLVFQATVILRLCSPPPRQEDNIVTPTGFQLNGLEIGNKMVWGTLGLGNQWDDLNEGGRDIAEQRYLGQDHKVIVKSRKCTKGSDSQKQMLRKTCFTHEPPLFCCIQFVPQELSYPSKFSEDRHFN